MSLYLDTSVVIALLTEDPLSSRAYTALENNREPLLVSDVGAAEFAAVVGRNIRTGNITRHHGVAALVIFDQWSSRAARLVQIDPVDVAIAGSYLRRLDLALFAPDAIHIAFAERFDATLLTFDRAMAVAARTLGLTVLEA